MIYPTAFRMEEFLQNEIGTYIKDYLFFRRQEKA